MLSEEETTTTTTTLIQKSTLPPHTSTSPFESNLEQLTTSKVLDGNNTDTSLTGLTIQTLEDHEEEGSLVEHKEIIPLEGESTGTVDGVIHPLDQTSIVTQQFHENILDQDDEPVMVSSDLITEGKMDTIKQIATDFVKSLSEEALEIVKDKIGTSDQAEEPAATHQETTIIPQITMTLDTDSELTSDDDKHPEVEEVQVPQQFQFQTSFRTHFVAYFDGDSQNVSETALASGAPQDLVSEDHSDHGSPLPEDQQQQQDHHDDNQTHPQDNVDFAQDKSSQLADDASEDIWAGEDAVMLRKSKTTFSVKSSKTDSESVSHSMSHEPDTSSASGAEQFHTAHGSSSRPSSSDVEAMLSAHSGRGSTMTTTTEYETANSHADLSAHSSSYHTAASTLSSKSFSDHSGGHLASVEHSETSDTLIDVSIEHDRDAGTPCGAPSEHELAFDDEEDIDHHDLTKPAAISGLVRSPDMIFNQEEEESRENLTGSVVTISSASDQATVRSNEGNETISKPVPVAEVPEESLMVKSTALTESTSSASSEKAIASFTPQTGSGEILGSMEDLKKDDSPLADQHKPITRIVSFDTSNLESTAPSQSVSPSSKSMAGQKSFESSDFDSRPESELKDFENRPHSISEAMVEGEDDENSSRPGSKISEPEMDYLKKHMDPFQRPVTPEPPETSPSAEGPTAAQTEIAFSTHFTQVIEDEEEYVKLEDTDVPEFKIMTAVEVPENKDEELEVPQHQLIRATKSFESAETASPPPTQNKPLSEMMWPASADLNLEDDQAEPVGKKPIMRNESDEIVEDKTTFESDDVWGEEACEPQELPSAAVASETSPEVIAYPYNPPLDQIIEEEEESEEVGAQLQHLKDLKESLSSTPEFEKMHERLYLKLGEKENSSTSSLQEFETLEQQLHSGTGSRGSLGSADSLELAGPVAVKLPYKKTFSSSRLSTETSSQGSSGSLQEFEQMEDACRAAETLEHKAKHQEVVLSEIEEGHESQISESDSCETLSQGGKSDDSDVLAQRMQQIDEIIRQAQTNVETFQNPRDYMAHIMEASTDSLEAGAQTAGSGGIMVTSTDSLEEKLQSSSNGEDTMKISTDSIELSKKVGAAAAPAVGSSHQQMVASSADPANLMLASTDSLESGSTNTKATASLFSSYGSSTSETFVSEMDQDFRRAAQESAGLGKLMETDEECGLVITTSDSTVTTQQCHVSYGFNVSEVILPEHEGGLASTIERTVEMPAEVTKIQFKGPDAEQRMHEYVQAISGGQNLQEVESIDASGNVVHKTVIQHKIYPENPNQSEL